jgi:hypothetical protein
MQGNTVRLNITRERNKQINQFTKACIFARPRGVWPCRPVILEEALFLYPVPRCVSHAAALKDWVNKTDASIASAHGEG